MRMIKNIYIIITWLYLYQIHGMVSPLDIIKGIHINHGASKEYVSASFVLPREYISPEEQLDIWENINNKENATWSQKKKVFHRNLSRICTGLLSSNEILEKSIPKNNLLEAYASILTDVPKFAISDYMLQRIAISIKCSDNAKRLYKIAIDVNRQFAELLISSGDKTLNDLLREFLIDNMYKIDTANFLIEQIKFNCAEHMLSHFIDEDEKRMDNVISGFFLTSRKGNYEFNKSVAINILDNLLESRIDSIIIKNDIREEGIVAILLYKQINVGDIENLGQITKKGHIIAFSTSSNRDLFFPTSYVKLVLTFSKSISGKIIMADFVSCYPDAIAFSRKDALSLL